MTQPGEGLAPEPEDPSLISGKKGIDLPTLFGGSKLDLWEGGDRLTHVVL